jgi:hypothetical protein
VIARLDCELLFHTTIVRSANRYGRERSSTALSTLKIAVFAPMPERHRDDRDEREHGIPPQHSHRVLGVHLQFLSKLGAIHVGLHIRSNDATFVANEIEIAKTLLGRGRRHRARSCRRDVSAPLQLEVRRQFLGDLLVDRDRPDEAAQDAGRTERDRGSRWSHHLRDGRGKM